MSVVSDSKAVSDSMEMDSLSMIAELELEGEKNMLKLFKCYSSAENHVKQMVSTKKMYCKILTVGASAESNAINIASCGPRDLPLFKIL